MGLGEKLLLAGLGFNLGIFYMLALRVGFRKWDYVFGIIMSIISIVVFVWH
jgi:hypothetical protein